GVLVSDLAYGGGLGGRYYQHRLPSKLKDPTVVVTSHAPVAPTHGFLKYGSEILSRSPLLDLSSDVEVSVSIPSGGFEVCLEAVSLGVLGKVKFFAE
ncbi:hypothetical protein KI387_025319, partial [Taxus chinensis]